MRIEQQSFTTISIINSTIPIFLYNLVNFSFTIVDSLMVAPLGEENLGAVGQAGIFFNVVMMFFLGIFSIYTPLISRLNIRKDKQVFFSRLIQMIFLGFIFSLIVITICSFTGAFFTLFGQPSKTSNLVVNYIEVLKWSSIFALIYSLFAQTVYILEKAKIILYTVIFGNLLNVLLNWIFIYGKFGFPQLNVAGSALSTLIVRILMLLVVVIFVSKELSISFFKSKKITIEKEYLKNVILKGIPKGVTTVNDWFASFVLILFVGWGGVTHIASNQVADLISSLMYMLPQAFCVVITIHLSKQIGQNQIELVSLKSNIIELFRGIIPINLFFILVIFILLPYIIRLFSLQPSTDAFQLAYNIMLVHISFFVFYALQYFLLSVLDSLLDTKVPSIIAVLTSYLFVLPSAFILSSYSSNPVVIWIVDGIGNVLMTIFLGWRVISHFKKHSRSINVSI